MKTNNYQELLTAIMRRNGFSQRSLAQKAGVDHVALCRLLSANYAFKPTRILPKLIDAVGATAAERVQLYRLCGIVPPELVAAFCADEDAAAGMLAIVEIHEMHDESNKKRSLRHGRCAPGKPAND